jgi:hypothetical protein
MQIVRRSSDTASERIDNALEDMEIAVFYSSCAIRHPTIHCPFYMQITPSGEGYSLAICELDGKLLA